MTFDPGLAGDDQVLVRLQRNLTKQERYRWHGEVGEASFKAAALAHRLMWRRGSNAPGGQKCHLRARGSAPSNRLPRVVRADRAGEGHQEWGCSPSFFE